MPTQSRLNALCVCNVISGLNMRRENESTIILDSEEERLQTSGALLTQQQPPTMQLCLLQGREIVFEIHFFFILFKELLNRMCSFNGTDNYSFYAFYFLLYT